MTAVFIAHTKVLSAIRLTTKQKKLQITIPKLDHFIHRILRECSRLLWSNTYLFSTNAPSIERQKNLRLIENFLQDGVLQGIRGMLPVKNILREYLKDDESEEEEEEAAAVAAPKKGGLPPIEPPKQSETLIVENNTPISFTGSDTRDHDDDSEDEFAPVKPVKEGTKNKVVEKSAGSPFDIEDEEDEIKILEGPPEQMDEFEDLVVKDEMAVEYETLE
jgi:hypothetical protein